MVTYLYKHRIWTEYTNLIGADDVQEALDKTDFDTNYKSQTLACDDLELQETTVTIYKTYTHFKALITGDIAWTDVKLETGSNFYDLYLITESPI